MKKIDFLAVVLAVALTACGGHSKKVSLEDAEKALYEQLELVYQDTTLSEEQCDAKAYEIFSSAYGEHKSDSLGLECFLSMIVTASDLDALQALYEESDTLVHNNLSIRTKMASVANIASTSAGCAYKEITGVDALSGEPLALSSLVGASGKPLIIDFWASWCGPCRRCIKNHLLDIYKEGKINIVGVAVWEDSVEDTRKAMEELGITWPVIFTGGRSDSPSIEYGVMAIPTLLLVSADGTILSRGYDIEKVLEAL